MEFCRNGLSRVLLWGNVLGDVFGNATLRVTLRCLFQVHSILVFLRVFQDQLAAMFAEERCQDDLDRVGGAVPGGMQSVGVFDQQAAFAPLAGVIDGAVVEHFDQRRGFERRVIRATGTGDDVRETIVVPRQVCRIDSRRQGGARLRRLRQCGRPDRGGCIRRGVAFAEQRIDIGTESAQRKGAQLSLAGGIHELVIIQSVSGRMKIGPGVKPTA